MQDYRERYPQCVYSLNQSLANGFNAQSTPSILHILIRNSTLYWRDEQEKSRWMTGTEALLCQAFPLDPNRPANKKPTCSFHFDRAPGQPRMGTC